MEATKPRQQPIFLATESGADHCSVIISDIFVERYGSTRHGVENVVLSLRPDTNLAHGLGFRYSWVRLSTDG